MIEAFIIFACMGVGAILDRRDAAYAAEWQLILDRLHHGTPIKPYDWELEV
jgi:hypothetical protein